MFGHDLKHTGTIDEIVKFSLELFWKYKNGDGVMYAFTSVSIGVISVSYSDKNVYTLDASIGSLMDEKSMVV